MVGTFLLPAHPYTHIGITLPCASEIGRKQIAVLQLGDGGGMGRREGCVVIEKLVLQDMRVFPWNIAVESIVTATYFFRCAVREHNGSRGVGGYRDLPFHLFETFLPVALNRAVRRMVSGIDKETIVDVELWLNDNVLITCTFRRLPDASETLVAPGKQVAQQHDVVAGVH